MLYVDRSYYTTVAKLSQHVALRLLDMDQYEFEMTQELHSEEYNHGIESREITWFVNDFCVTYDMREERWTVAKAIPFEGPMPHDPHCLACDMRCDDYCPDCIPF